MTDPIADMLARIRNAQAVRKPEVVLPFSKTKFEIAKILNKEGFIGAAEKTGISGRDFKFALKYNGRVPRIKSLKRISKPGQRIYVPCDRLPYVLNNLGIAIISSSQGLMTNKEARKKGIGGEVICEVY